MKNMYREVKFRGISKRTGNWLYGYLTIDKNSARMEGFPHFISKSSGHLAEEVIPKSVGQFSGLEDSKGYPIYEGDKFIDVDNNEHIVIFGNGMFGSKIMYELSDYKTKELIESLHNFVIDGCTIVGNIHNKAY